VKGTNNNDCSLADCFSVEQSKEEFPQKKNSLPFTSLFILLAFAVASVPAKSYEEGESTESSTGAVQATDSSGNIRLWGRGRPNSARYGTDGESSGLCTTRNPTTYQNVYFGLSKTPATWASTAQVCPAGTWVCTAAERGESRCNTTRPDSPIADAHNWKGRVINWKPDAHIGFVADSDPAASGTISCVAISETGKKTEGWYCANQFPVWCCSETTYR